jgi:hypothetical protein
MIFANLSTIFLVALAAAISVTGTPPTRPTRKPHSRSVDKPQSKGNDQIQPCCKCIYRVKALKDDQVTGTFTKYLQPQRKRGRSCDHYCAYKYRVGRRILHLVGQTTKIFKITSATGEEVETKPLDRRWGFFAYEPDGGEPDVRKVEADGMDLKDLPQDNYQSDAGESGVIKAEPEKQPTSARPRRKSESDKAGLEKQQTPRRNSYPQDKHQFDVGEPGVMEAELEEQPTSARPRRKSESDKAGLGLEKQQIPRRNSYHV